MSIRSNKRRVALDLIAPLLAVFGLYWFSASFFLAKRSLPYVSRCDEGTELLENVLKLSPENIERALAGNDKQNERSNHGCWMDRNIDSLVILVVDALRFDFARYHLPMSVGSRLEGLKTGNQSSASQLLQFVADPPTVTMQRLKGLTTGGLPTFADISGNFGGAAIDEDSWIQQLKTAPYSQRALEFPSRLGFVGDDTWSDLFPTQFEESFPFPSFNTRDLDTVDNGCLVHLPQLLASLRKPSRGPSATDLEVIVTHFLGVDHVGHTYGPHDKHMDQKLRQMDAALSTTLDVMDESEDCHLVLIFGDHGMTEDGNHGGGTDEEVNAALFVHFSPACAKNVHLDAIPQMGTKYVQEVFQSIHQIDLVPTISVLLGLPIPYANIGGIVPSLLQGVGSVKGISTALALNAAQVWRYFSVYSEEANRLPRLSDLEEQLREAVSSFERALADDADDSNAYIQASGLFKIFLVEASELGHRVWTRFDTIGMVLGTVVVGLALAVSAISCSLEVGRSAIGLSHGLEMGLAVIFIVIHCGALTFSNSYIESEQKIVMFLMSIVGIAIYIRFHNSKKYSTQQPSTFTYISPLFVPLLSRLAELLVSGHGLDPSIRLHVAHSPWLFLPSLLCLVILRIRTHHHTATVSRSRSLFHCVTDCVYIFFLSLSWIEKRSLDHTQNGYLWAKVAMVVWIGCIPLAIHEFVSSSVHPARQNAKGTGENKGRSVAPSYALAKTLPIISKLLCAIMLVTGPATSSTVLIICLQGWIMFKLGGEIGFITVHPLTQALIWRLMVRHAFFATNHGCAFNRLQYSSAFVATIEFNFVFGGVQLFLNTFGWEIIGLLAVWMTTSAYKQQQRQMLWKLYFFYQLIEGFVNCISVSVLRRHLMVWAIYAPRFIFSSIFLFLSSIAQLFSIVFPSSTWI